MLTASGARGRPLSRARLVTYRYVSLLTASGACGRPLSRAEIIAAAKDDFDRISEELLSAGLADTFDTCAIAFFHDMLLGGSNDE